MDLSKLGKPSWHARKTTTTEGLGKIRWVVEAALSWFNNHRRLRFLSPLAIPAR